VRDHLGWHVARVVAVHASQPPDAEEVAVEVRRAARLRVFARWLDERRAADLTLVPGLEHPGDPTQPDNHHRH
jgi:[acyl-carrier-protein] S-malonyltransferase